MDFQKGKINLESSTKTERIPVTFLWEVSEGLWGVAYILCHTGHKLYTVFGIKYMLFIPYSQRVNSSPEEVFYFLFVYLLINLFILKFICSTVLNDSFFFGLCSYQRTQCTRASEWPQFSASDFHPCRHVIWTWVLHTSKKKRHPILHALCLSKGRGTCHANERRSSPPVLWLSLGVLWAAAACIVLGWSHKMHNGHTVEIHTCRAWW